MAEDSTGEGSAKRRSRYSRLFGGGGKTKETTTEIPQAADETTTEIPQAADEANIGTVQVADEASAEIVQAADEADIGTVQVANDMGDETAQAADETDTETVQVENEASAGTAQLVGETPNSAGPRASKFATFEKWFGRFVATVLTLAVLGALVVGSLALVNGSWEVNPILSGSMRPGLSVGGVVISERVPVSQLVVRDVIVFREPNSPSTQIVHRIVKMTKSKSGQLLINTQGDANTARDPWTLTIKGDYAYRARWSVPLVGYVAVAYENNRGIALLGAGVILIAVAATAVWKPRRRGDRPSTSDE
jgi:signal peptidase I